MYVIEVWAGGSAAYLSRRCGVDGFVGAILQQHVCARIEKNAGVPCRAHVRISFAVIALLTEITVCVELMSGKGWGRVAGKGPDRRRHDRYR